MYAKQSSTKRTGVRLTIFPVSPLRAWPNGNWQCTQHALVCMWSCVHMLRNMRHALIQQDRSTHGRESLGGSSKKASPGRFKKKNNSNYNFRSPIVRVNFMKTVSIGLALANIQACLCARLGDSGLLPGSTRLQILFLAITDAFH